MIALRVMSRRLRLSGTTLPLMSSGEIKRDSHSPVAVQALPAILAAVAALAIYSITLGGTYVYDDVIVHEDPRFTHTNLWPQFWTRAYMPDAVDKLYRPLTCLSFAVEYSIHGDRPWAYHLINILLHAGAAAAVAELARRLRSDFARRSLPAFCLQIHPVHVEAASPPGWWDRPKLLCTLAMVVAMILFLRAMTPARAAGICGSLAVAILSKEQINSSACGAAGIAAGSQISPGGIVARRPI